jgi:hypothetical protein
MKKMLKKLLCKHHYEYYHQDRYYPILAISSDVQWHYLCKKCGKTSVVQRMALDEFIEKMQKKVAKEKAMGVDVSEYADFEKIVGSYTIHGKVGYYVHKRLSNYHQTRSVVSSRR